MHSDSLSQLSTCRSRSRPQSNSCHTVLVSTLGHFQACSAIAATILRPPVPNIATNSHHVHKYCVISVCHFAFLRPVRPLCRVPSVLNWQRSRLCPCRCCSNESAWWMDMPQQQELNPLGSRSTLRMSVGIRLLKYIRKEAR